MIQDTFVPASVEKKTMRLAEEKKELEKARVLHTEWRIRYRF